MNYYFFLYVKVGIRDKPNEFPKTICLVCMWYMCVSDIPLNEWSDFRINLASHLA